MVIRGKMSRCISVLYLTADATIDLTGDVYPIDATGGSIVLTLPDMSDMNGITHIWRRTDNTTNTVTLQTVKSQTIDGNSTLLIPPMAGLGTLCFNGNMSTMWGTNMSSAVTAMESAATADTTTTSSTDVTLLTVTPTVTGRYLIIASLSVRNSSVLATITGSIYVNGSQIGASSRTAISTTRTLITLITCDVVDVPMHTQTIQNVVAGQAIDLRWKTSGGTATAHQRTLTILKVG